MVEVILKKRFKLDRKLGDFLVNATRLTSGQEGVCGMYSLYRAPTIWSWYALTLEQIYHSSNRPPTIESTISFSGLPTSSADTAESSGVQPNPQQTTTIPHTLVESAVDNTMTNVETLNPPAGLETVTATVDTATQIFGQVQSALDQADSLKGTLKCLDEASGYLNGIIEFVKDFANVSLQATSTASIRS
jgi:hypothetical protein